MAHRPCEREAPPAPHRPKRAVFLLPSHAAAVAAEPLRRHLSETHPTDPSDSAFSPPAFSASRRDVALYVSLKNLTMEVMVCGEKEKDSIAVRGKQCVKERVLLPVSA